jgi:DNA-directed RNA polymerase subunit M/transcription elongation factor TFIIS
MRPYRSPAIHRTPLYRAKAAYSTMIARCLNKNGRNPSYANVELRMTREEWLVWAVPEYEKFQKEYPEAAPNAARIADIGHYEVGNIRIVSQQTNAADTRKHGVRADGTKWCSGCKKFIDIGNFAKNGYRWDGFASNCKDCTYLYDSSRRKKNKTIEIYSHELIHGTRAGYEKELAMGITTCEACREANAIYTKERRLSNSGVVA